MSIPVAGTGRSRYHSKKNRAGKPNGVMSSSRLLPHRYADEGDKGPQFRRTIRRLENIQWRRERGLI
ncbi:hypothetical protein [Streptomyces cavernae]|uniref:hypothetical protein n=1 Tax=Streptomyces cavernae TaxID=2259034 RepID=UPI000FEBBA0F|nr:hypothetical protein [Streptomyces cavernae]